MKPATELIHAGERIDTGATQSLTVPIYETSTFIFDSVADVIAYQEGKLHGYLYSRYENPTVVAVEQKVAAVDGAEAALLFSSGMAAISTTLLTLLKPGDEILCSAAIYGGTFHIIEDLMAKFGVERRFITLAEFVDLATVIGPKTRMVWFESPINPTLRLADIGAVVEVEAGTAYDARSFYKDLFQAAAMPSARFLCIAVMNAYHPARRTTPFDDFARVGNVLDTLYASAAFRLDIDTIMLLGY